MTLIRCPYCVEDIPDNSQKCPYCDELLNPQQTARVTQNQSLPTASYCVHCGVPLAQGARFCSSCGGTVAIGGTPSTVPLPPLQKPKSNSVLDTQIVSDAGMKSCFLSLIMWAGFLGAAYFLLFFDTTVAVPETEFMGTTIGGGRVNNIGLMQERQMYMLFCGGVGIVALVIKLMPKQKN